MAGGRSGRFGLCRNRRPVAREVNSLSGDLSRNARGLESGGPAVRLRAGAGNRYASVRIALTDSIWGRPAALPRRGVDEQLAESGAGLRAAERAAEQPPGAAPRAPRSGAARPRLICSGRFSWDRADEPATGLEPATVWTATEKLRSVPSARWRAIVIDASWMSSRCSSRTRSPRCWCSKGDRALYRPAFAAEREPCCARCYIRA